MILLLGYKEENTIAHLMDQLDELETKYDLLDLAEVSTSRHMAITEASGQLSIQFDETRYDLESYQAFYCRYYYKQNENRLRDSAMSRTLASLTAYLDETDKVVVNSPRAGSLNSNKYLHIRHLKSFGFQVPDTYVFGDAEAASQVIAADGNWVSKSISGVKTRAAVVTDELLARLPLLDQSPSQFQKRVRGKDVRVHCVGQELIPLEINSTELDYRFAARLGGKNEFNANIEVPEDIASQCRQYCTDENLSFAGFDFKICDDSGEWIVLEANPMPGYDYFDRQLDGRISKSLAKHLLHSKPRKQIYSLQPSEPFIPDDRRPKII